MWSSDRTVEYSVRCYGAMLSLYPAGIRSRFGRDMMQVFQDVCRDEVRDRGLRKLLSFWLRTLTDIILSIVQEHGRRMMRPSAAGHPVVALYDSLLIPTIVIINLLVLGPVVTMFLLRMAPTRVSAEEFLMTSATVSVILGAVGIVRAVVVARLRPTVRLWVKLS